MKIDILKSKRLLVGVILLIVMLVATGVLMARRMSSIIDSYVCDMVTEQMATLADLENEKFESEYRQLLRMAGYLETIVENQEEVQRNAEKLFAAEQKQGVEVGIVKLDGTTIYGRTISQRAFSGIRKSFQGHSAVSYEEDGGVVVSVPIHRGQNVKYVLYYYYDYENATERFSLNFYEGAADMLVVDRNDVIVIPSKNMAVNQFFLKTVGEQGSLLALRDHLNVADAAALIGTWQDEKCVLFVAEIGETELLLMGMIPCKDIAGDIEELIVLVLWVFGLLLILLISGIIFLLGIEKKARESKELMEAKEEAERANNAKSEFLSSMSHEIRTPLNAILGMNEMILRESRDPQITSFAHMIHNSSTALLAIINDVLDISKIEAGETTLIEDKYELLGLLRDSYTMISDRAEKKNLEIVFTCEESLPSVLYGDMTRVRQILMNLLTNAVKYTPQGSVAVVVEGKAEKELLLLHIEVRDTGIGMKREDLEYLFEKFKRFDLKRNQSIEGTGLGMSITSELLRLMNGTIEVESEYGSGSSFKVMIPQRIVDASPIGVSDVKEYVSKESRKVQEYFKERFVAPEARILVVDDMDINLVVVKNLLKETRIQIDTVLSGAQCLECATTRKYDMIFMDHMMPDMDGVETLQKLKELEHNPNADTPIIMLTANALSGMREQYLEEGFADYLTKPIRGERLENMIIKYLPANKIIRTENQKNEEKEESFQSKVEQQRMEPEKMEQVSGDEEVHLTDAGREQEAENTSDTPKDGIDRLAEAYPQFHVDVALPYCAGNREFLLTILKQFVDGERDLKLEEQYKAECWDKYRIQIHALKSTCLTIGFTELSERAKALEMAAKGNDIAYIKEYHQGFLEELQRAIVEIRRVTE